MELVSPLTFIYTVYKLRDRSASAACYDTPTLILITAFLTHYTNRALISPLRTPSRSNAHIIVPLLGAAFNLANGYAQAYFLATSDAPAARHPAARAVGLTMWLVGFVGNVYHDEILIEIRRRHATARPGDERAEAVREQTPGANDGVRTKKQGENGGAGDGEHYGIPEGGLYRWVSYPNYLCEWIEWAGFAYAAAPVPISLSCLAHIFSSISFTSSPSSPLQLSWWTGALASWRPTLPAPYVFVLFEVCSMLPRAVLGHRWYKERFGERYPAERWAVLPGVV
jgi:3-oxo-5-alpha-steroid 4-dehydrogenase 1